MKTLRAALFTLLLATGHAIAQDQDTVTGEQYHPYLTDKWMIGIGGFWPKKDLTVSVFATNPVGINSNDNIEEDIRISEDQASGALLMRWRFGEKWSLQGQYFALDTETGYTLEEDIEWEDIVFKEGSFVNAGGNMDVARLFLGRSFSTGPRHEFGLGIGLHWMEFGAFIEGDVQTSEGGTDFQRGEVKADFPLPNIGGWYYYSWHRDWMLQARVDWLSVSFGDYSGGLINGLVGIDWRPFERVGFGLAVNSFVLDADVDMDDWRGSVEYAAYGPLLTVNFSW